MRNQRLIIASLLILLMPFLLAACSDSKSDYDSQVDKDMAAAANGKSSQATALAKPVTERFVLQDVNGNTRKWSEFYGKPILINFWATWCGPCRREIATLKNMYEDYHDKGLEIIAISVDDQRTIKNVAPFVKQNQIPWVVVYTDKNAPVEFGLGRSIPFTVLINSNGEIVDQISGARAEYEFRQKIERLF